MRRVSIGLAALVPVAASVLVLASAFVLTASPVSAAAAGCPSDIYRLKGQLRAMREGNIKNSVKRLVAQAEGEFKAGMRKKCNDTIARAVKESEKKPVTRKRPTRKRRQ